MDINYEDYFNKTPMHIAVWFDNEEYFKLLRDLQPNDDWKTKYGGSLLDRAVIKGNTNFLNTLVKAGIDINSTNEKGSTALEIAKRRNLKETYQLLMALGADSSLVRTIQMKGKYLDENVPGLTPKVFASSFISTEEYEFGSVFNADFTEFYYGVNVGNRSEIRYSKRNGEEWSKPEALLSNEHYGYNDPFLSPDENRLYFISQRPLNEGGEPKEDHDIWYVERTSNGWSEPINAGPNINTEKPEYYISFTKDGTMYFSSGLDICYAEFINGEFQKPIFLDDAINTNDYEADVFVDPDENYIIFCSMRPGGLGRGDLYISFKNPDSTWTKAVNMGDTINTEGHELCPFVTADGKYLLYTSNEDIVWVSTEVIKIIEENIKR
ncbi:hypothetical protein MHTCC0001_09020 [Flavobacteriaceae bacterium MHTCC 0001]